MGELSVVFHRAVLAMITRATNVSSNSKGKSKELRREHVRLLMSVHSDLEGESGDSEAVRLRLEAFGAVVLHRPFDDEFVSVALRGCAESVGSAAVRVVMDEVMRRKTVDLKGLESMEQRIGAVFGLLGGESGECSVVGLGLDESVRGLFVDALKRHFEGWTMTVDEDNEQTILAMHTPL